MRFKRIILFILVTSSAIAQPVKDTTFLPKPTGPYNVGTLNWYPEDTLRDEPFTHQKGDHRRLFVKVWYPAAKYDGAEVACYMQGYDCTVMKRNYTWMKATRKYFRKVTVAPTNSMLNVPAAETGNKFPVVVFSPGYGFGAVEFYHSILENLSSHGYIVCAIVHPYESAMINYPDGTSTKNKNLINLIRFNTELLGYKKRAKKCSSNEDRTEVIRHIEKKSEFIIRSHNTWVCDTRFVLDQLADLEDLSGSILKEKIDLGHIGAIGHSFGGSVAGQTCSEDDRIKAGINIDGWQYGNVFDKGVKCPLLVICAETNGWFDYFYHNSEHPVYSMVLPTARHFTFTDLSVLPDISDKQKIKYLSTTNTLPNLQKTNDLITGFFDSILKEQGAMSDFVENCRNCKITGGKKIGLNTCK